MTELIYEVTQFWLPHTLVRGLIFFLFIYLSRPGFSLSQATKITKAKYLN